MTKKKYMVVPRTPQAMMKGLQTGKGRLDFKGKSAMFVGEDLASEIDTQHGLKGSGEVYVVRDENLEWHRRHDSDTDGRSYGIHHYTFAGVDTQNAGGNEAVWVKTKDGVTKVSREYALENGLEIVKPRKRRRRVTA